MQHIQHEDMVLIIGGCRRFHHQLSLVIVPDVSGDDTLKTHQQFPSKTWGVRVGGLNPLGG